MDKGAIPQNTGQIALRDRNVGNYQDHTCPECNASFQTGKPIEMKMPYCGNCGKIVLDAAQSFCCWCGCQFQERNQPNER